MKIFTKLISIMLISIILFSASVLAATTPTCHAGVLGIDVSHHQGEINWEKVAEESQVKYAFIKATDGYIKADGKYWYDDHFKKNIINASNSGILVSPYHFARPYNENPEDEAKWFLLMTQDWIKRDYLRPVLDIETPDDDSTTEQKEKLRTMDLQNWIRRYMNYIRDETGQTPILYVNKDYYMRLENLINEEGYDIWIADPSTTACTYPLLDEQQPIEISHHDVEIRWIFWQWYDPNPKVCGDNKGAVPGIDEPVDLDIFDGSESELLSFRCDSDQGIAPTIQRFEVESSSLNLGASATINFEVSDAGGSGLKQVELWRKDETSDWQEIKRNTLAGENGPLTGSFTDSPPAPGTYWYGVHVVDNAGNWNDERNSNTNYQPISFEPVEVEVIDSSSAQGSTNCDSAEAKSWFERGVACYDQFDYTEAIDCFDEATKICPQYEEAWAKMGDAYLIGRFGFFSDNNPREAIRCYDKALNINPQNATVWNNKGTAFNDLRQYDDAIQCYDEALNINPQYAEAWYGKGHSQYNQGNYDGALQSLEMAIALYPEIPDFWYEKGVVLEARGSDEAQAAFNKAEELETIRKPIRETEGAVAYD